MKRRANRKLLDEWIGRNGPDGISRLAVESNVSASTITKARCGSVIPKKESTLQRICEVIGVKIDELFPLVRAGGKAS